MKQKRKQIINKTFKFKNGRTSVKMDQRKMNTMKNKKYNQQNRV